MINRTKTKERKQTNKHKIIKKTQKTFPTHNKNTHTPIHTKLSEIHEEHLLSHNSLI
jgi:hypothetical protein